MAEQAVQESLFDKGDGLPQSRPVRRNLAGTSELLSIFQDCHNHIYANQGLLKDKIFQEMVQLLLMKIVDEKKEPAAPADFAITADEYRATVEGDGSEFKSRIGSLFGDVHEEFSELFSGQGELLLEDPVLAYVVARLQHVSLLDTPDDIKGAAFQTFVNRHQRGDRGEFFTPHPVVDLAVSAIDPGESESLIDPACGSGGFLTAAISHVESQFEDAGAKTQYIRDNIRGIEFNPDVAQAAALQLVLQGGSGAEIECRNSLGAIDQLLGTFDIVVTNPPFGNRGKIEERRILSQYELAQRWRSSGNGEYSPTGTLLKGQTPEILFLERCVQLLKPGGRLAIVVPDGLLQNPSEANTRYWLRKNTDLLGVVSMPEETFVPYGTGVKTSVLVVQKPNQDETGYEQDAFMAKVSEVGYDTKGKDKYQTDSVGNVVTENGKKVKDETVTEVARNFRRFLKTGEAPETDRGFPVKQEKIESRLDVEFYTPEITGLIDCLQENNARTIGDIATVVRSRDRSWKENNADIDYISISDIDTRLMKVGNMERMPAHEAPSRASYRVEVGDIITALAGAKTGTPGHATAYITEAEDGAICTNGLAVVRNIEENVNRFYLLAYMKTRPFLRQMYRYRTGHAIPAVSRDDFENVLVPIPSEEVQEKIGSRIRSAFEFRKKASRNTEASIQTLKGELNELGL